MTTPDIKYPANEITPHGWYWLTTGSHPTMRLSAYDGSIDFYLMGGHSIPDRIASPEAVHIPRDGLTGLIPPWKHITQKGATEDGVTQVDALYDPIEVGLKVICRGRDAKHTRRVVRDLIASLDAKQQARLSWITQELGHWWADVVWWQGAPQDPLKGAQENRQQVSLRLMAESGFWRTYDDSDSFGFTYTDMVDEFDTDHADDAGPDWPVHYYGGTGGGHLRVENGRLVWVDDPDDPITTEGLSVVYGPYRDFETTGNTQVVSMKLGSFQELTFPDGAENGVGARLGRNPDGTWDGNGVFAIVGGFGLRLVRFNNFVETTMRSVFTLPPFPNTEYTLIAGSEDDERMFTVLRNGVPVLKHKEAAGGLSPLGPDYRGVGGMMRAGGALITQATPASVLRLNAGDNATISQSGFLRRVNVGDQPMYDDYTLFGPGMFKLYDGPESDEYVEFGPLLPNQIVFLRTDPRTNTTLVQDLTAVPPTPQQLNIFQDALSKFLSFAGMDESALGDQIKSFFGIRPPQGNLYKYLRGRFSENAAIPPKSPGRPAEPYFVKCEIDDGNADSRVIVSGTPLRRWPL